MFRSIIFLSILQFISIHVVRIVCRDVEVKTKWHDDRQPSTQLAWGWKVCVPAYWGRHMASVRTTSPSILIIVGTDTQFLAFLIM